MEKQELVDLLNKKIDQIDSLKVDPDKNKLHQWRQETLMVLDQLIGDESKYYKKFEAVSFQSNVLSMGNANANEQRNMEARLRGLEKANSELDAIIFGISNQLI